MMFNKKAYQKNYYREHAENRRAYSKKYLQEHPGERREYQRKYRQEHAEEIRAYHRAYSINYHIKHGVSIQESNRRSRWKLKTEILTYYGGGRCVCIKCGFSDLRALSLDHIYGGGGKHRKKLGSRGTGYLLFVDIKRQGFPGGYQTLCMNCQRIKQFENKEWPGVPKSWNSYHVPIKEED